MSDISAYSENVTLRNAVSNAKKKTRRTPEERAELDRAKAERKVSRETRAREMADEKTARARAVSERVTRITAQAKDLAACFERRATRPVCEQRDQTSSMRKAVRKMVRAASDGDVKAEREAARIAEAGGDPKDRGTGLTRMKMQTSPVGRLRDAHKIGQEEEAAADQIAQAYQIITSRVAVRGMTFERVDKSSGATAGEAVTKHIDLIERYTAWANHWSRRAKLYSDATLEIVVAAVVDERAIYTIAADTGFDRKRVEKALVGGLRDYAARAGGVGKHQAERWVREAESVFQTPGRTLGEAMRRAKMEL